MTYTVGQRVLVNVGDSVPTFLGAEFLDENEMLNWTLVQLDVNTNDLPSDVPIVVHSTRVFRDSTDIRNRNGDT